MSQPGKFAPRKREFNYARDAALLGGGFKPDDDRTLKPNVQADVNRNRYKSIFAFRPFPMFNAENPTTWDPYRLEEGEAGFGDWMRRVPAVREAGEEDNKVTFLLTPQKDMRVNPYQLVYDKARALARKEGHKLELACIKLITPPPNQASPLKKPNTLMFMQGAIYRSGKQHYWKEPRGPKGLGKGDRTQIIQIVDSGARSLLDLLEEHNEGFTGSWKEFNKFYKYGDPVNVKFGRFIYVWHPNESDFGDPDDPTIGRGGDSFGKPYLAHVSKLFMPDGRPIKQQITASMLQHEEKIRSSVQWWEDLLYYPSLDEMAFWTAKALRSQAKLVTLAWGDNPEYLTEEVKGVLKYRSQLAGVAVPRGDDDQDDEGDSRMRKDASVGKPKTQSKSLPKGGRDRFQDEEQEPKRRTKARVEEDEDEDDDDLEDEEEDDLEDDEEADTDETDDETDDEEAAVADDDEEEEDEEEGDEEEDDEEEEDDDDSAAAVAADDEEGEEEEDEEEEDDEEEEEEDADEEDGEHDPALDEAFDEEEEEAPKPKAKAKAKAKPKAGGKPHKEQFADGLEVARKRQAARTAQAAKADKKAPAKEPPKADKPSAVATEKKKSTSRPAVSQYDADDDFDAPPPKTVGSVAKKPKKK